MKRLRAERDDFLKLFFYGIPGSTKTRTAGTAALDERTAPALHLDIGGNTLSLADFAQQPTIVEIDEIKDLNLILDFFKKGQPATHDFARYVEMTEPFKTITIDGFTDLHDMSMGLATGQTNVKPGDIPAAMQIQNWGQVLRQMTNIAKQFYHLPLHVIVTALEATERDNASGTITAKPAMGGQSGEAVPAVAYNVGRLVHMLRVNKTEQGKMVEQLKEAELTSSERDLVSVVYWQPSTKYVAKDQHGLGVPYMIDPTLTKILDLREANRTGKSRYEARL